MSDHKTLGENRVRTTFNPSDDSVVQNIKDKAAELINYVNDNISDHSDSYRLKVKALDAIEEAAMWAVKAATA